MAKIGTAAWKKNVQEAAYKRGNTIAGKPVITATTKMILDITDSDIKKGKVRDPGACPAAVCIMRTVPTAIGARVHLGRTYIEFQDMWVRLKTSGSLRDEIVAVDRDGKMVPGRHELIPLCPSERHKYGKRQGTDGNGKKKKRKRASYIRYVPNVRAHGANR